MIYSPSRTEAYDFCPTAYYLQYHEKIQPRIATTMDYARWLGSAFAASTAYLYPMTEWPDDYIAAAIAQGMVTYSLEQGAFTEAGGDVAALPSLVEVEQQLSKAVWLVRDRPPFLDWTDRQTEVRLPEHGNARIDLTGHDPLGRRVVADFKLKRRLEARFVQSTIDEYRDSWQMYHYVWAAAQHFHEPIHSYYIAMVVLEPTKQVIVREYPVQPETLSWWIQSAGQKWAEMESLHEGSRPLVMNAVHRNQYGRCKYYDACFSYRLDVELMSRGYLTMKEDV